MPKMTKEFVAAEILTAIREERHDPPIGDEAKGVLERTREGSGRTGKDVTELQDFAGLNGKTEEMLKN